ncbi:MAG: hypothetical protein J6N45_04880 [Alphaproteobacteria bacterium]|nr:hypothetical protein [Alphaproteobacteria bacterium]
MTKEEMKAKMSADHQAYEDAMKRVIDFVVDTVSVDKADNTGGYFSPDRNSITVNYIPGKNKWNEWTESENVAIHEQKHRDNATQGMGAYAVSPEQAYKRNMHNEISANIASLIALRQRYLETGDLSLFDKREGGRFAFYKEAIEKGEINPNSPYQEDFDKEMHLIVNGTQKMWMKNFAETDLYIDCGLGDMTYYGDYEGKYAAYWDENYRNAMKIAYNIGGVDFTKYMDKDVEIPEAANSKMIEEIANSPSMQEYYHLTDAQVFEKSGFPPYDGSISLYEYKKLLQHQLAVNNYGQGHSYQGKDGEIIYYTPQEYLASLNSKDTIERYRQFYAEVTSEKVSNADEVKEKFPTFESYLKYMQDFDAKDYQEKFNEATSNEAFIDKIVEYQAAKYAKTGKEFPHDNPENYQKALNKLYCGAYDILKPDETKLKSELSESAEKLQNRSAWERTMENYLKSVGVSPEVAEYKAHNLAQENKIIGGWGCFVGGPFLGAYNKVKDLKHRMTYITDENGKEQNVGLWGKIKHKAKQIKEDLTTEVEIDEDGTKWVGECSVWKGLKNKISSWFKPSPQQEPIKNEPINPVNKGAPEYPKWSKDNRVSEVQHKTILDMRKPIIKQPTTSRSAMKNADKSSIKNKMSADSTNAQKASHQQENVEKKAIVRGPDSWEVFKRLVGWSRD